MPRAAISPTIDPAAYHLDVVQALSTPRLLVYRSLLESNIAAMKAALAEIVPGSGFRHLRPHVKTCKSSWVVRKLIAAGVGRFKCSLNELEILLECAADVFVAYPLLPAEADRVARAIRQHSDTKVYVQLGSRAHAEWLVAAARAHDITFACLVDLDVGNRRTGVAPDAAARLVRDLAGDAEFTSLKLVGVHAYDGHNNSPDPHERTRCSRAVADDVAALLDVMEAEGRPAQSVVASGSPPFQEDLRELSSRFAGRVDVQVSPGTWVYWDSNYEKKLPGKFSYAAVLLAQVIDRPGPDLVTLNLGHKRWAIDHGPVEVFSRAGLEVVAATEEHTVIRCGSAGGGLELGDSVLIVPRHICPTVNLWERFSVIGVDGKVEAELPVDARNR